MGRQLSPSSGGTGRRRHEPADPNNVVKSADFPILKDLPPTVWDSYALSFQLLKHNRGEPVFQEGDPPEAVFLLRSGLVKAVKHSPQSELLGMEVIMPGHLFGMIAVMDNKPYPVSVVPIQPSEIYRIPAAVFRDLMTKYPPFSKAIFAEVGEHLRLAQNMRSLYREPMERRVAYILGMLLRRKGDEARVRREEVAELAGCTPETAIRILGDFKKKKLIATGWKRIVLLDPEGLKSLATLE